MYLSEAQRRQPGCPARELCHQSCGRDPKAGRLHGEVEEELRTAGKLTPLAALVFYDDKDKGGDVMKRLNQFGGWAGDVFKQCNEGTHKAVEGDMQLMIRDTERLTTTILDLKP